MTSAPSHLRPSSGNKQEKPDSYTSGFFYGQKCIKFVDFPYKGIVFEIPFEFAPLADKILQTHPGQPDLEITTI
jgi:hypothetical protein